MGPARALESTFRNYRDYETCLSGRWGRAEAPGLSPATDGIAVRASRVLHSRRCAEAGGGGRLRHHPNGPPAGTNVGRATLRVCRYGWAG